jgi:hypothetical protein
MIPARIEEKSCYPQTYSARTEKPAQMVDEREWKRFSKRFSDETLSAIQDEAKSLNLEIRPDVLGKFHHVLEEELDASLRRIDSDRKSLGITSWDSVRDFRKLPTARGAGPHREFARLVVQNAAYEGRTTLTEGDLYRAFVEAGKRCAIYPIC